MENKPGIAKVASRYSKKTKGEQFVDDEGNIIEVELPPESEYRTGKREALIVLLLMLGIISFKMFFFTLPKDVKNFSEVYSTFAYAIGFIISVIFGAQIAPTMMGRRNIKRVPYIRRTEPKKDDDDDEDDDSDEPIPLKPYGAPRK